MTHPAHRVRILTDALVDLELRKVPTGHTLSLGRTLAEALGEPAERWGKKFAGAIGITADDLDRVAKLVGGRVAIVVPGRAEAETEALDRIAAIVEERPR